MPTTEEVLASMLEENGFGGELTEAVLDYLQAESERAMLAFMMEEYGITEIREILQTAKQIHEMYLENPSEVDSILL